LDKATFSNIEQQSLEFVMHTLTPWLVRWEEAIKYSFLDPEDGLNVEFPTRSLLRGDATARSTYYHNGILDGWMTRNEARISESLNPLEGLDEPLRPLNMVEESEVTPGQDPSAPNAPNDPDDPLAPTDPTDPTDDKPTNARMHALADATAHRVARKEAAMVQAALRAPQPDSALVDAYAKHAEFIGQALSISKQSASAYCVQQIDFVTAQPGCDVDIFTDSARLKLTRLALKGAL
jgi:hypothetical protein